MTSPLPLGIDAATPLAAAFAAIANDVETAVADLGRMIAVDTTFPPGAGYDAFADLMEDLLVPLGFSTRRIAVPEERWRVEGGPAFGARTNLVAERPAGRPVLGLYYHVDTVPVAAGWQRDPFRLTREGDVLHGLGAADMKGTVAATLLALRVARDHGVDLAWDPKLLLCSDEEGGLWPGVRHLADLGEVPPHVLNFNGSAAPRIWAGCFGLFNLLIRVHGHTVHAGEGNRTGPGVNAVEAAVPLMASLLALKPEIAARTSALPAPPHATGPLVGRLDLTAAHGGTAGGQIPALHEILVTRRYAPEESFEDARAEIAAVIDGFAESRPDLRVETLLVGHLAPTADPGGPHWPRWQAALSAGFGWKPEEFARWGAASCSDFGWVQRATGSTEVLLGGLGRPESRIHSPEEHTTVGDLVALARSILAYLAADFATELVPAADRRIP